MVLVFCLSHQEQVLIVLGLYYCWWFVDLKVHKRGWGAGWLDHSIIVKALGFLYAKVLSFIFYIHPHSCSSVSIHK
ncbi:hypothetical protein Hanom_Chr05g00475181 [Helianthus anomalus]